MHPRAGRRPLARRTRAPVEGSPGLRPRPRRRPSARGRRPLLRAAASRTTGAARRARRRTSSTACTTAALLRVVRREAGSGSTRRTSTATARRHEPTRAARVDALVDVVVAHVRAAAAPSLYFVIARLRYGAPQWRARAEARAWRGPRRGWRTRAIDGVDWYWPADERRRATPPRTTACACWRRSIRSCGTAADSSCSGAGRIASRRTRRWRSASSATTRCRCCGATAWSAGRTCRCATACCTPRSATPADVLRDAGFATALDAELDLIRQLPVAMASTDEREVLSCGGREVAITNPRKVLFPEPAITKLDLAHYYLAVAEGALRGAGGRPNVLVRYPNGIGGEFFYQKRAPDSRPDVDRGRLAAAFRPAARPKRSCRATPRRWPGWPTSPASSCTRTRCAPTISIIPTSCASTSIRCPASSGRRSARSRAWSTRRSPISGCRLAEDVGLARHPRLVRIARRWTFDQVRRAALALAREVERRAPGLATSKWWKEERHGVFLDYNQNAKDRTVAGAYSVRPKPDARVSAPLTWDEIADVRSARLHAARRCRRGSPRSAIATPASTTDPCSLDAAAGAVRARRARRARRRAVAAALSQAGGRAVRVVARRRSAAPARPANGYGEADRPAHQHQAAARDRAAREARTTRSPASSAGRRGIPTRRRTSSPPTCSSTRCAAASTTWTRIRVNLQHVPEALRPAQEPLDPDEDPLTEDWQQAIAAADRRRTPSRARTES